MGVGMVFTFRKMEFAQDGGVHPSLDVTTMLEGPQVDRKIADAFSTNHCQAPRDRESRRALCFFIFFRKSSLKININK